MQKRLHDVDKEEGTDKHRLHHYPCWKEIRSQIAEKVRKREQQDNNMQEKLQVTKRSHDVFSSEGQWLKKPH